MCKLCDNELYLEEVRYAIRNLDVGVMKHCPICGKNILFFEMVNDYFKQYIKALRNTITDENGKPMLLDRQSFIPSGKQAIDIHRPTKPMDMTVDLDKIDISKELEMLEEYEKRQPKVYYNPYFMAMFEKFCEEQEDDEDDE